MENQVSFAIKDWAEEDRPREKLLKKGRSTLSNAELIALLIGSGNKTLSAVELARKILHFVGNDLNELAKLSIKDLQKFNGIGEAKAISIAGAIELGRRRKAEISLSRPIISTSEHAYQLMIQDLADLKHEEFWILLLKRNNELIKKVRVSVGGVSGTIVDAKIIFRHALEELATGIVLVHNHPSGNLRPSDKDKRLTKQLVAGGKILDVKVVDHLIVTDKGFYSFSQAEKL